MSAHSALYIQRVAVRVAPRGVNIALSAGEEGWREPFKLPFIAQK